MKNEINNLLKGAVLDSNDYGGKNEYYNTDNKRIIDAKKRIKEIMKNMPTDEKIKEAMTIIWGGRLSIENNKLNYTAGQYYPLELAECIADVLEKAKTL